LPDDELGAERPQLLKSVCLKVLAFVGPGRQSQHVAEVDAAPIVLPPLGFAMAARRELNGLILEVDLDLETVFALALRASHSHRLASTLLP
jgi:hypothetical protein